MNEELGREVVAKLDAALSALAERLGQGADYFWPILVREQVVSAVGMIVGWVFLVGASSYALRWSISYHKRWLGEEKRLPTDDDLVAGPIGTISCVILFVFALIGCFGAPYVLRMLFTPEATALRDLLEAVK